ncbi:MAG: hypothetical protein J6J78_02755 [Clostridia bacterium]|nr:hypothetical protein [Clostridia bacterium]
MAMSPGMKMMMLQRTAQDRSRNQSEYGGGNGRRMIGYDRDMNGNAPALGHGVEPGRDTPMHGAYGPESRQREGRGRYMYGNAGGQMNAYGTEARRQRDSRGRYMTADDVDYEDEEDGRAYSAGSEMRGGNGYGDIYAKGTIYAPGAMNKPAYHGDRHEAMDQPVDERTARKWVKGMKYTEQEGGEERHGEKFSVAITEQIRKMACPRCKNWEFYVAMNAMYADYCKVAKKEGVDKPEFYGKLAEAFLCDEDAGEHKLRKYMEIIPEQ